MIVIIILIMIIVPVIGFAVFSFNLDLFFIMEGLVV